MIKSVYIVCAMLSNMFLLSMAMISPVFITPGYYWWTIFCIILLVASDLSFTRRVNSWGDLGEL